MRIKLKNLVFFCSVVLSFLAIDAHAQVFTNRNNSWGTPENRRSIDSVAYMPTFNSVPTSIADLHSYGFTGSGEKLKKAAILFDSLGGHWYGWNPRTQAWSQIDGGGGGSGGNPNTKIGPGYWQVNGSNNTVKTLVFTNGVRADSTTNANAITIFGVDAAADGSTKGVAAFNATRFVAPSGVVDLADINSNVFGTNTFLKFAVTAKGQIPSATPVLPSDLVPLLPPLYAGPGLHWRTDSILALGNTNISDTCCTFLRFDATHQLQLDLGSDAIGDLPVRGTDNFLHNIHPGTAGQVLTSNGSGAVPIYQGIAQIAGTNGKILYKTPGGAFTAAMTNDTTNQHITLDDTYSLIETDNTNHIGSVYAPGFMEHLTTNTLALATMQYVPTASAGVQEGTLQIVNTNAAGTHYGYFDIAPDSIAWISGSAGPSSIQALFSYTRSKVLTIQLPNKSSLAGTDSALISDVNNKVWKVPTSLFGSAGGVNPFADNTDIIKNSSDATKLLRFNIAGFTTGTTRTWTFPDVNGTVARNDAAQTFGGVQSFTSNPVFNTTSVAGQIWTANNTAGGGSWANPQNSVGRDTVYTITAGSSSTVPNGNSIVQFNPTTTLSTYTLTLPTTWHTSNKLTIKFGGTITSGPVVATLIIINGSGHTLIYNSTPNGVYAAGEPLSFTLIGTFEYRDE